MIFVVENEVFVVENLFSTWLSEQEHKVDALALRAEERRDQLRIATGRSKYPLIRGYLNGETHMDRLHVSIRQQGAQVSNKVWRGTR